MDQENVGLEETPHQQHHLSGSWSPTVHWPKGATSVSLLSATPFKQEGRPRADLEAVTELRSLAEGEPPRSLQIP